MENERDQSNTSLFAVRFEVQASCVFRPIFPDATKEVDLKRHGRYERMQSDNVHIDNTTETLKGKGTRVSVFNKVSVT